MVRFYCSQMKKRIKIGRIISTTLQITQAYNGPIVWQVRIICLITIQFVSMIVKI